MNSCKNQRWKKVFRLLVNLDDFSLAYFEYHTLLDFFCVFAKKISLFTTIISAFFTL